MFGITHFTAIINPPQAAILALGGSRPVLDPATETPHMAMCGTLCADARVVDDSVAARFMEAFRAVLEEPMLMLSQGRPVDLQALFARP